MTIKKYTLVSSGNLFLFGSKYEMAWPVCIFLNSDQAKKSTFKNYVTVFYREKIARNTAPKLHGT